MDLILSYTFSNGAEGYDTKDRMRSRGSYEKIKNCPISGTDIRRTCHATGRPDTMFSVPAYCTVDGQRIDGYFMVEDDNIEFYPNKD